MPADLISVVIPNYNYVHYLSQAIDSALAQSYQNVEVIVVDDGSTDDSQAVVLEYGDRVRWFQHNRQGVSVARNRGIQESRGRFVAFLDADDVWLPEKLSRQMELMDDPSIGMVYCGLQYIDIDGHLLGRPRSGHSGYLLKEIALFRGPGVPASGSTALVRKDCFERIGLFDPELSTSADWDMYRRIACYYQIAIVSAPLVLYRLHHSAMHRNVAVFEHDMLHAFAKMFADPAAREVHPLRRRCYGNLYVTLSGAYLHARRWDKCLKYAMQGVLMWPPGLGYLAAFPIRLALRQLRAPIHGLELLR